VKKSLTARLRRSSDGERQASPSETIWSRARAGLPIQSRLQHRPLRPNGKVTREVRQRTASLLLAGSYPFQALNGHEPRDFPMPTVAVLSRLAFALAAVFCSASRAALIAAAFPSLAAHMDHGA